MKLTKKLGVMGALALASLAPAATSGQTLNVHVPFSFVAAGREFPAGDYRVYSNGNGTIYLQGGSTSVITLSVPAGVAKPGSSPNLQFSRAGQKEYLVGVQDDTLNRSIPLHTEQTRTLALSR